MEARANVTKGRPGRCMTGGFGMDRRAFGRACGDRAFGLGAFGPDVFKRTPSIADLKPACRFVAKHSYHGDVILLVVDAAPENGFAVPGPGKAAPAAAYVDAGGFAAVLTTGSASVPSNDSESGATAKGVPAGVHVEISRLTGGHRGGAFTSDEIAEKMCHADI